MWLMDISLIALMLDVGEGLWRGGNYSLPPSRSQMTFRYMAHWCWPFLLILTVLSFIRRDLNVWLGIGVLWALGFVAIVTNLFRLGEVIWTNGRFALTLERLAPTWAALGWLVFMLGVIISVRSAHARSRQPLLRNRLNYWTPVFLLIILNDILLIVAGVFPGNPIRLGAVVLAAFIIVTHDPPDLREVAQRV